MSRATLAAFDLRTLLAVVVLAAGVSPHAFARTWRVERDGTGDFATIQPAALAAAPGDTILLGPGHYTEYTPFGGSGTLLNYYVFLEDDNVTLLGVDRDLVTIGPNRASGFDPIAVAFINAIPSAQIVVEGITFSHSRSGIVTNETHVTVRNCRFESNEVGLNSNATVSVLVENCEFIENSSRGVLQFDAATTPLLVVRNCQFQNNSYGIDSQEENNLVENCTFTGNSAAAILYSARAAGTIRGCSFSDNDVGIRLSNQSTAYLVDNVIVGGELNLGLTNGSHASGSGNILSGGSYATMDFTGQATATMSNNHFLQGTSTARIRVRSSSGGGHIIDFRNNYWGTASAQEIAASILDSNDSASVTGTVLFEPFFEAPVATRRTSFGEFKRLFSGEN